MSEEANIERRLERIRSRAPDRPSWPRKLALPGAMLLTGVMAGLWVANQSPSGSPSPSMETSEVSEFQTNTGLSGFTVTEDEPLPFPAATRDPELEHELERLRVALQAAEEELAARDGEGDASPALEDLRMQLLALQEDGAARDAALDELMRENLRLETELDLAEQRAADRDDAALREAEEMAELERRRMEQEMLRAQQEAELASRARSPMVAYRAGGSGGDFLDEGDFGDPEDRYSTAERFRRGTPDKADAIQSELIGDPSRTVVQGTLIEATLTNAISSQLEGNVSATVSYDVWSMDMQNVLIPRGSKLFGRYSSGIERGQRRILVAWDRVVTPGGESATLSAYGTDRVGRTGLTGRVSTHALSRFGAAAAVSLINAVPTLAAASIDRNRPADVSRNTAVNIGNDASDVIGSIMKDYIDVPPTISVDQGAVVMVMVNADVEMF